MLLNAWFSNNRSYLGLLGRGNQEQGYGQVMEQA